MPKGWEIWVSTTPENSSTAEWIRLKFGAEGMVREDGIDRLRFEKDGDLVYGPGFIVGDLSQTGDDERVAPDYVKFVILMLASPSEPTSPASTLSSLFFLQHGISSDDPPSLVRAPSEYVHDDEAPSLPSQRRNLTQPVLTGHVAEVRLDLLMVSTSEPRYLTRSRTGNQRRRTLESSDGVAVMPLSRTARETLGHSRIRRGRSSSSANGNDYQLHSHKGHQVALRITRMQTPILIGSGTLTAPPDGGDVKFDIAYIIYNDHNPLTITITSFCRLGIGIGYSRCTEWILGCNSHRI